MALQAFLSFLFSVLFPDDLQSFIQPLTDVLNVVIVFAILAGISWAFVVLCAYLLFGIQLPLHPSFENETKEPSKHIAFNNDTDTNTDTDTDLIDLGATSQGEQLFVDGYKLGYKHGKTGEPAIHKGHSNWDDAAEGAIVHLRQSFHHDEEEARKARKTL